MATEWYYAKNGRQHGPVPPAELKRLANDGTLKSADLVWKEGMEDWAPAGQVQGLLPYGGVQTVEEVGYIEPYQPRRRLRGPFGQIMLVVASVAMIASLFLPWWSMTIDARIVDKVGSKINRGRWARQFAREYRQMDRAALERSIDRDNATASKSGTSSEDKRFHRDRARFSRVVLRSRTWWERHVRGGRRSFQSYLSTEAEESDDRAGTTLTLSIWGWNEGVGIAGLVLGAIILIFAIVFLAVPPLRAWNWIISLVAALMGLLVVILTLIWIFSSPGEDVGRYFNQGIIIGPYILLFGGGLLLIVGVVDGIFGIISQMRLGRAV